MKNGVGLFYEPIYGIHALKERNLKTERSKMPAWVAEFAGIQPVCERR